MVDAGYITYDASQRAQKEPIAVVARAVDNEAPYFVDYIGDVPWDRHAGAKDWYARVKSRPSFRPLLSDQFPGVTPPAHYADLDF